MVGKIENEWSEATMVTIYYKYRAAKLKFILLCIYGEDMLRDYGMVTLDIAVTNYLNKIRNLHSEGAKRS